MELERAYEQAACGLLTTALDGTIERVNATLCTWMETTADVLLGQRFPSLLTIGSKLFHQTHWSPLLQMQGSVAEVQLELRTHGGRVLPVLVNAARVRRLDGDEVVEIAVFVAADRRKYERELLLARRRAEELLERAQEAEVARAVAEGRVRLALESANLRVWSADPKTGARQYEPGVAALLGYGDRTEVDAAMYEAHMRPEDRLRDAEAFRGALDREVRATYSLEYPLVGHDGVERVVRSTGRAFFDEDGEPMLFSGVLEDITDRRRAEEALRQRELEFRALAENSPDAILRFARDRRIVYVSPAVTRLTGRPRSAYLGRTLGELHLEPTLFGSWAAAVDEAFQGRPATLAASHPVADGSRREFQSHIVPEMNARGVVVSVLAITRDVTALRRQELEAQHRAVFAEQLVGIVSHDLRNPLNAISLAAQVLRTVDLGSHVRVVERIASSTRRATRLIADLLDFTQARLGSGLPVSRATIDLHAVVADTLDEVRMSWPDRVIAHHRGGSGSGMADPDRVAQLVTNLVTNALVYGAAGRPVVVTSEVGDRTLRLHVHNEGDPIPEPLQARMFEPLRRGPHDVERGSRSVGLGLYIVREIALAHGGEVALRSSAEEGTRFTVTLPRAP